MTPRNGSRFIKLPSLSSLIPFAILVHLLAQEFGGIGGRILLLGLFLFGFGALRGITRSSRASAAWAMLPLALVTFASRIKHRLWDYPLYFWDLKFLVGSDQWDVLRHYLGIVGAVASVLAVVLLLGAGILVTLRVRRGRPVLDRAGFKRKVLVPLLLGAALTGAGTITLLREARGWLHPDLMGLRHPFSIFLISSLAGKITLVPAPAVDAPSIALPDSASRTTGSGARSRPHLIMVLQESLMDPWELSEHWKDREHRWDSVIRAGARHGTLRVHVFGGGTWSSEFTSLVGLPTPALGLLGGYSTYIMEGRVKHSLVSHLQSLGYRTVSIYPGPGSFVNGGNFHRSLGFDRFLDVDDQPLEPGQSYWTLSDRQVYSTVLRVLEEEERAHPGQPVFVWVKMIRNHGPHGIECENPDQQIVKFVEKAGFSATSNCELIDYLTRAEQSMTAYSGFRAELARKFPNQAFSVMQFGDHQPTLTESLKFPGRPEPMGFEERHRTFWSLDSVNADPPALDPSFARFAEPGQPLDLAYLGAFWLKGIGLPLDGVLERQLQTAQVCEGEYPQEPGSLGGTESCLSEVAKLHAFLRRAGAFRF